MTYENITERQVLCFGDSNTYGYDPVGNLTRQTDARGVTVCTSYDALNPAQVRSISALLAEDAITFAQAREVLDAVNGTEDDPERVVDERGLRQVTDTGALEPIVDEVLGRCADQVQQYHDGNKKVIGFLVGQCMKAAKGSGNPKLFNQLLAQKLG